jgi:murein L,D-transpeptidase YcbB/YkuD
VIALALLALSGAADAQDAAEQELLRTRVEHVRDDPDFRVRGTALASRRVLPALYARREFSRAWTDAGVAAQLVSAIREIGAEGLDPEDYLLAELEAADAELARGGAGSDVQVDRDLLLTDAMARLFYHLLFGKIDPQDLDPNWNFTRSVHRGNPAEFLQQIIASGDVRGAIERELPDHEMYRDLKAELARQRALEARGGWPSIPSGPKLEAGARDPRVAALREHLLASGDLHEAAAGDAQLLDPPLEAALRAFQTRHGLDADGVLGPATLAELNVPVAQRIAQIELNLERGRWLLHDLDPSFVVVNIAGYQVFYLRDGRLVWSARAQVGKPFRATPIFRSELEYLVLNPTWTVPPGILAHDILPAQRRNPGYLASKHIEVIDRAGRVIPVDSVDWSRGARSFPYQLRQAPGPGNSLGVVKFMFPNAYAVYLHDTPSKNLFEKTERAFSSGCIRVENPLEFAALLLEGQKGWDRAAIDAAVAAGRTRTLTLAKPLPVLLAYWTAWVASDGSLQHRRDVYGRDAALAAALDQRFRVHRPVSAP